MRTIRTLVIDDEPLARSRIVKLCQQYDRISILAEAKNGKEATQAIHQYHPDLIFLDVQMPDFNGFEVLKKSTLKPMPFVIFVTAFDAYALKAFDVHAVDYLLKPFDEERFDKAIQYAFRQISLSDKALLNQKMLKVIEEFQYQNSHALQSIEIKEKGRTIYIKIDDIHYFETHGNYVKIHCAQKTQLYRNTLQDLENQLDKQNFLRIHRSILINIFYIHKVKYCGNNQFKFTLKNKIELLSSRSYKEEIQQFLENQTLKGVEYQ